MQLLVYYLCRLKVFVMLYNTPATHKPSWTGTLHIHKLVGAKVEQDCCSYEVTQLPALFLMN